MIGGIVLQDCLQSDEIRKVTSLVRRPSGVSHAKLDEILCNDFLRYEGLEEHFKHQDIAFFCIGAYTGQVPDELFKQITVDFTQGFADLLKKQSPEASFCFLSGAGADQKEKSRVSFARYKGMAENCLIGKNFKSLFLFRPAYIYPVTPRKEPNLVYTISRFLYPLLRRLYPNIGISSEDLARAMVYAGLYGTGESSLLENKDIRAMVR